MLIINKTGCLFNNRSFISNNKIAINKINKNLEVNVNNPESPLFSRKSFSETSRINENSVDVFADVILDQVDSENSVLSQSNSDDAISNLDELNKQFENIVDKISSYINNKFDNFFNFNNHLTTDATNDLFSIQAEPQFDNNKFKAHLTDIFMKGKELCNSSGSLDKDNLNALLDKEFKTQGNSFEDLSFKDLAGIYEGINLCTSSKLNSTKLYYSVRTGFINALTEKFILNSSISDNAKKLFLSTMNALTEYKTDVHSFSILDRVHANNLKSVKDYLMDRINELQHQIADE